jgi:hypothetical protein
MSPTTIQVTMAPTLICLASPACDGPRPQYKRTTFAALLNAGFTPAPAAVNPYGPVREGQESKFCRVGHTNARAKSTAKP